MAEVTEVRQREKNAGQVLGCVGSMLRESIGYSSNL